MAVDQSTAPPVVRGVVRTCIGCRERASVTELLRVVAVPGADQQWLVIADPRRHAAGRGASVHPDPECVAVAERRRAFARALRIPGPVDASAVAEFVAINSRSTPRVASRLPAGRHGSEKKHNEPSMKRQR